MLFGAAAQTIPDLDFISSLWLEPAENLLAHRGFTHSFLFAILITGTSALVARRWYRYRNISLRIWVLLLGINIFTHLFIDAFNEYGTGWFEPFRHKRVSFYALFVADPLFTIWPLIASIVLLVTATNLSARKYWWLAGIGFSTAYLVFALINRGQAESDARHNLAKQSINYNRLLVTPTPLNSLLWYVVAEDSSGFYVGYHSVFDPKERMEMHYFPQRDSLLRDVQDQKSLQYLRRFSQGFYTVEKRQDSLVFNDLRFGQIVGWHQPNERFVFQYFLQYPEANKLVLQRGRFARWNEETVNALLNRIEGLRKRTD